MQYPFRYKIIDRTWSPDHMGLKNGHSGSYRRLRTWDTFAIGQNDHTGSPDPVWGDDRRSPLCWFLQEGLAQVLIGGYCSGGDTFAIGSKVFSQILTGSMHKGHLRDRKNHTGSPDPAWGDDRDLPIAGPYRRLYADVRHQLNRKLQVLTGGFALGTPS